MYGGSAANTIALTTILTANVVGRIPALRRVLVPAGRSQAKVRSWARPASPICCPYPATGPHHCAEKLLPNPKSADEKAFKEVFWETGMMVVRSAVFCPISSACIATPRQKNNWHNLAAPWSNQKMGRNDSAKGKKKYGGWTTAATDLDLGVR